MNIDSAADSRRDHQRVAEPARERVVANRSLEVVEAERPVGISADELSVPSGLNAAETTNRIGNSAKTSARMPTRWRQPTCRNQPPFALPEPDDLGGGLVVRRMLAWPAR